MSKHNRDRRNKAHVALDFAEIDAIADYGGILSIDGEKVPIFNPKLGMEEFDRKLTGLGISVFARTPMGSEILHGAGTTHVLVRSLSDGVRVKVGVSAFKRHEMN